MNRTGDDNGCIANRLRQARKEAGLSQKALGELAGIDPNSASARINQYETGKHTPHFGVLKQIAKALAAPVSYFYEEDDELANLILELHRIPSSLKEEVLACIRESLNIKI